MRPAARVLFSFLSPRLVSVQLRDGKQVLQCLQRGLKVARSCPEAAVQAALYVEVLNVYIGYFKRECEAVRTRRCGPTKKGNRK